MLMEGRRSVGLLAAALLLAACADHPAAPGPAAAPDVFPVVSQVEGDDDRPDEAEMLAFARRLPALAGYHVDAGGGLVVSLTDLSQGEAARAMLAGLAARHGGGVRVRPARWSFLQLREWRDALFLPLMEMPGVTLLDLDEMANRVAIGIATPELRAEVIALAQRLDVPLQVLDILRAGPLEPLGLEVDAPYLNTAPVEGDSITSYRRPLQGGLQISYRHSSDPDRATNCTLGFMVVQNGDTLGVTASHCSLRHWDLDGVSYFQNRPGVGRHIGYEVRDPNGTSCGFLSLYVCRHSESLLVFLERGVPVRFGEIARPIGPPPIGQSPYGVLVSSLRIDPANPTFRIVASRPVERGEMVHKVGIASGWTRGRVERSCADLPADRSWSKLRCQTLVDMSSTKGDSGGPVFLDRGDGTVTLAGLLWGRYVIEGVPYAAFSSVAQLEKDLGSLQFFPVASGGGAAPAPAPEPEPGFGCDPECMT
jgi:hypothetical protein